MQLQAALYLIPVPISDVPLEATLPASVPAVVKGIKHFIVENVRTARRFIRRCGRDIDIDSLAFSELNRHTDPREVQAMLDPLRRGEPVGVMSEAGCPAVADPGAVAVAAAQREGFKVVPLTGPSSILMSLMASGFSGQGFAFHGYLPIDAAARAKAIRDLETESARRNMTQIFIETPYRNDRMLATLSETLRPSTRLCVACDLTDPETETVISRRAADWRGAKGYDKRPAIFLIYAGTEVQL